MVYQKNSRDILRCLSFSFYLILFAFGCHLYNVNLHYSIDMRVILLLVGLPVLLSILLLIDYNQNATKGIIELSLDEIAVRSSSSKLRIPKNEIISARVYGSPSIKRKSFFRVMPWEAFHYVEIVHGQGQSIIITSLSDYGLYWSLSKEPILRGKLTINNEGSSSIWRFFNSITWNKMD